MILVDYSGVAIGTLHNYVKYTSNGIFDSNEYAEMVLKQIAQINQKFKWEYGKLIICRDSSRRTYWRKDILEHYKAFRKTGTLEDNFRYEEDKKKVRAAINDVAKVLTDYFPYKIIKVERCEADDVIATLAFEYDDEEHVIISRDQDFKQLLRFNNVKQFDPVSDKYIISDSPAWDLFHKIVKGEGKGKDAIPNILSNADSFYTNTRQTNVTKKFLERLYSAVDFKDVLTEEQYERYEQNTKLVDLSHLPDDLYQEIIKKHENYNCNNHNLILEYINSTRPNTLFDHYPNF